MSLKKQLRKEFASFLKKLSIPHEREYTKLILKAVSHHNTFIETISNQADSLHYHLGKEYLEIIDERFYQLSSRLIKQQRLGLIEVIVDITDENFYGKTTGLFIHPWTGEKGVKGKFHYLVAGILFRNKILPFYVAIMRRGEFKADTIGNIVELCNKMHLQIRCMYLDRGFYAGDVINELELRGMNYLVFAKKSSRFKCMLESVDKKAVVTHEIKYKKDKSSHRAETNIALVKNVGGYDWCFATNLFLQDAKKYVRLYRRRWNIETMFRVHDEARIKSKSIKPIVRLFYFMISMLLVLLWNLYAKQLCVFKKFLIVLGDTFENFGVLEIR